MGLCVHRLLHVVLPAMFAKAAQLAVLPVLVLLAAASADALGPARSMAQFHHTKWSLRDGVPANVVCITQTPDGFLWLGSTQGLFRFDGVRAEQFGSDQLRGNAILSLATASNGDLWIGL